MKIGVVHFGCALEGTAQIVRTLIEDLSSEETTVYAIEWNHTSKELQLRELNKMNQKTLTTTYSLCNAFPRKIWDEKSFLLTDELQELDQVILLGVSNTQEQETSVNVLQVPVSIYNTVENSQFTLGYDTALNSIVNSVESVRDTASSLSYGKVRLFNVQIPGNQQSRLLFDAAGAVGAEVVTGVSPQELDQLHNHIKQKEDNEDGYTFFMMDHSIDLTSFEQYFSNFDLDWKIVVIDDSQCGGPYPTAHDRLLANQLKTAVVKWCKANKPTGQLLIQDNKVVFK